MKVCVVGGNGNIGRYVVLHLLKRGHRVVCANRGLSGSPPEGAELIQVDRHQRDEFERKLQSESFDAAIDMVCMSREDALSSVRAFRGVLHFVNCSSVATYGREFDEFPTSEDHPLRPWTDYNRDYAVGKAEADEVFMDALRSERFPVTLVKPSITYGPRLGLLRQIGNETSWISRIRKGMPLAVAGDGISLHQFMHADDAGRAFALVIGKTNMIGRSFNLVCNQPASWATYHRSAMEVIGREVELVGIPSATLLRLMRSGEFSLTDIFWQNSHFSDSRLRSYLPEFAPEITLKHGIEMVLASLDREGRIVDAESDGWEDRLIEAQRRLTSLRTA